MLLFNLISHPVYVGKTFQKPGINLGLAGCDRDEGLGTTGKAPTSVADFLGLESFIFFLPTTVGHSTILTFFTQEFRYVVLGMAVTWVRGIVGYI